MTSNVKHHYIVNKYALRISTAQEQKQLLQPQRWGSIRNICSRTYYS